MVPNWLDKKENDVKIIAVNKEKVGSRALSSQHIINYTFKNKYK